MQDQVRNFSVEHSVTSNKISPQTIWDLWSDVNNCSAFSDTLLLPNISTSDSCSVELIAWHSCDSNIQVLHYRIINGGHTWPGAPFIIGTTNQDIIASSIIWEFFNKFSLNTGIHEAATSLNAQVYPNPFNSNLTIKTENESKSTVKIYSADGKLIVSSEFNAEKIHLNTSTLANGIYFLHIFSNDKIESFQIFKIE